MKQFFILYFFSYVSECLILVSLTLHGKILFLLFFDINNGTNLSNFLISIWCWLNWSLALSVAEIHLVFNNILIITIIIWRPFNSELLAEVWTLLQILIFSITLLINFILQFVLRILRFVNNILIFKCLFIVVEVFI